MVIDKPTKIFTDFFESGKAGGLLLIICTITSLLIANSSLGQGYAGFWHSYLDLSFSRIHLHYSLEHWVNDGLMAIFFLMVGLEIERELYIGELADFKKALLPILAAIGGMVVPGVIFFLLNKGTETQAGIGIPMATDIAFALGILSLLGKNIPFSLKIFLSAVAIMDDLGAIILIAIFYTREISFIYLLIAILIFCLLLVLNKLKVTNLLFYIIPGVLMWYCMLQSGVHATLSGILLAFAIPFNRGGLINPSEQVQHFLHKPVAFIILPIFALANTGIRLSPGWTGTLLSHNSLGIISGLALGKPIGILLICALAVQLKICKLPEGMNWKYLTGLGALAGIGFTMSIFISNMAFDQQFLIESSKIAVLTASLFSCLAGFLILSFSKKRQPDI
jgi:Na+:H+ antiporter, NhaA family